MLPSGTKVLKVEGSIPVVSEAKTISGPSSPINLHVFFVPLPNPHPVHQLVSMAALGF